MLKAAGSGKRLSGIRPVTCSSNRCLAGLPRKASRDPQPVANRLAAQGAMQVSESACRGGDTQLGQLVPPSEPAPTDSPAQGQPALDGQAAPLSAGLASLDVEIPFRGREYRFTTPQGDVQIIGHAVATRSIFGAAQALAVLLFLAVAAYIVVLGSRGRFNWWLGRTGSTCLIAFGPAGLSLLAGPRPAGRGRRCDDQGKPCHGTSRVRTKGSGLFDFARIVMPVQKQRVLTPFLQEPVDDGRVWGMPAWPPRWAALRAAAAAAKRMHVAGGNACDKAAAYTPWKTSPQPVVSATSTGKAG